MRRLYTWTTPMDKLFIKDLEIFPRIGATRRERATPQRITMDITIEADLSEASRSDSLQDTIDYNTITRLVRETAAEGEYCLIERLAGAVADTLLELDRVRALAVSVQKHQVREARYYGVEVGRRRE